MGTNNMQFHRRFRVWRRKSSERSSTFYLRFTAIGGSVSVGPRRKVRVLVESNAWTPKSRIFVEDSSGSSGRPWVSSLRNSKSFVFAPRGREPSYSCLYFILMLSWSWLGPKGCLDCVPKHKNRILLIWSCFC